MRTVGEKLNVRPEMLDRVRDLWKGVDSAYKFALGAYLAARVGWTAWSLVILFLFPFVVQNLDLFGAPVLAAFDPMSGERYVYSRQVDGATLTFRAGERGQVIDTQSGSIWSLRGGRALSGEYAGRTLAPSAFSADDVFPYHGVTPAGNPLLGVWERFDIFCYLGIAEQGYTIDGSMVYLPLYPALIRILTPVLGSSLFAGLVISNMALFGALVLLYRETVSLFGRASARRTAVYLLLFPSAFFMFAAYGESLFLFLVLLAFAYARKGQWLGAAVWGALAALTRLQGVLVVVPLFYLWLAQQHHPSARVLLARKWGELLAFLLIPAATVAFLVVTGLSLLATYEGELHARFVMPWENVWAAVTLVASGRGALVDVLNLLSTLLFAVMLVLVWYKLPCEYGLYALVMFLAPLFRMTTSQPLVSMLRYTLVLFPVFMLWGARGRNIWVSRAVVYLSFPLALFLSAQFMLWGWVG